MAGAPRPSIAAAGKLDDLDAASGSTFDQPGVAAIVFGIGAPIEETFDVVITQNSSWAYKCTDVEQRSFDDGVYRGVFAVFAGCNGSAMVISMAIERVGSDRWMLLNVFAPTLAEVEVAGRILATFDFLGDSSGDGSGDGSVDTATVPAPPATVTPTTVLPAQLPTATGFQAVVDEVGLPATGAVMSETNTMTGGVAVSYEHGVDVAAVTAWIDALPGQLGCANVYSSQQPPTPTDPTAWYAVSCDVVRDGKNFNVSVRSMFLEFAGYTTVQVTQW